MRAGGVVACVLIRKSENHFGKHKGRSCDFREKLRFKLYKNQIAMNRYCEGMFLVFWDILSFFHILILCCKFIFILIVVVVIELAFVTFQQSRHCLLEYFWGNHKSRGFCYPVLLSSCEEAWNITKQKDSGTGAFL